MSTTPVSVHTTAGPRNGLAVCTRCGSRLEAHTPASPACTVCTRYASLAANARKTRRDGTAPGMELTLRGFAAWFAAQRRECTYCSIPESLVSALGVVTQTANRLQRLGVDRLDTAVGYQPDNMVLCCFACNKAKSNTFTSREMLFVGVGVAASWEHRLAGSAPNWRFCVLRPDPFAAPVSNRC